MTKNMTKGLKYGVVIVLIVTGLFAYNVAWGLIALAIAGGVLWKMPINTDMDADLRATTKEIVKEVDPVPEEADKLPFIENEGTDPYMAGQAAMRNIVEMLSDEPPIQKECALPTEYAKTLFAPKEHIFSAADNDSKALTSFLNERSGSPREDIIVDLNSVKSPEVPLGEPRMPAVKATLISLDKIIDQPNQPRH